VDPTTRPTTGDILLSQRERILTVTLNRPKHRNALTPGMVHELCDALDAADDDDDISAIVFTGAGAAFSVGADLSGRSLRPTRQEESRVDHDPARDWGGILALRLFACTKPLVAAVNGPAAGLGATMLLPMDARLSSTDARFGFVFARRGIVPEACSTWFLPRVVGIATAVQWAMSGRVFPASEALAAGLIDSLHEPADLLDAAHTVAEGLTSASSPVSVALTRQLMWQGLTLAHPMEAHRRESSALRALAGGPDAAEGIGAFLEKRPARFASRPSRDLEQFRSWWEQQPFRAATPAD
jgi:enoyl-CoA hydratase/carnithine racemase